MFGGIPPLIEVLRSIPDPRNPKGRRFELGSILALIILALVSSQNSIRQIASWARGLDTKDLKALGFKRGKAPSFSTICRVLQRVDADILAVQIQKWLQKVFQACKAPCKELKIAVDAKTLRNSGDEQEGTPALRVLSVLVQGLGLILATIEIPPGTNELGVIKLLLGIVDEIVGLEGKVITMDAIFTQKEIADSIVKKGDTI